MRTGRKYIIFGQLSSLLCTSDVFTARVLVWLWLPSLCLAPVGGHSFGTIPVALMLPSSSATFDPCLSGVRHKDVERL